MKLQDTGNIEIFRESLLLARLRAYQIYADGVNVGAIRNGETISIQLPKGIHEIFVKLDWTKSNPVAVNIEPAKTTKLSIDYKRQKDLRHVLLTAICVAIFLSGVIFGIPAITGLGIGGYMVSRIGKLHLYQTDRT